MGKYCKTGGYRDLTGLRFSKLVVLKRCEVNTNTGKPQWNCVCDCGKQTVVSSYQLVSSRTRSCGCLVTENHYRKYPPELKQSRIYSVWKGMKQRCSDANAINYRYYGGKGIRVCDEWRDNFYAFYDWAIANGYRDDLTIDRIDNSKGYYPDNCRWASYKEQQNNRSNNKIHHRGDKNGINS